MQTLMHNFTQHLHLYRAELTSSFTCV